VAVPVHKEEEEGGRWSEGSDCPSSFCEKLLLRDGLVAVPDRGACCTRCAAVPPEGAHEGDEIGKSIVLYVARAEEGERG
jgi:hypothetical protein